MMPLRRGLAVPRPARHVIILASACMSSLRCCSQTLIIVLPQKLFHDARCTHHDSSGSAKINATASTGTKAPADVHEGAQSSVYIGLRVTVGLSTRQPEHEHWSDTSLCPLAGFGDSIELVQSIPDQDGDLKLLRQLRDASALSGSTSRVMLMSIDLAAVLLEKCGCKEAADQLRNADLTKFLAGERLCPTALCVLTAACSGPFNDSSAPCCGLCLPTCAVNSVCDSSINRCHRQA